MKFSISLPSHVKRKRQAALLCATLVAIVTTLFWWWILHYNFPPGRQIHIDAIIGQDARMMTTLGPQPRVPVREGMYAIVDSPVYFDVRMPRWFTHAQLTFEYKPGDRTLVGVGGQVGPGWQYAVQPPLADFALEDGWRKALFRFDVRTLYAIKNYKRFLIGTEGPAGEALLIRSLTILFQR